jgi:DNA recombination protein RmuC
MILISLCLLSAFGGFVGIILVFIKTRRLPDLLREANDRFEQHIRDEIGKGRAEASGQARANREEIGAAVGRLGDSMLKRFSDLTNLQKAELSGFAQRMDHISENTDKRLQLFTEKVQTMSKSNDDRLENMRLTVEGKLESVVQNNRAELEKMREIVDEKLNKTLNTRLTESFQSVTQSLENVQKGLGEMQTLAAGVGDLKKVLTNIKVRGTYGEVQLGAILEQFLAPDQYAQNVSVNKGSKENVEYAVRFPGSAGSADVWLPIDSKFPQESFERLLAAQEATDPQGVEAARKELDATLRLEAKKIKDKYIAPPETVDFAVLFIPTESLYAEVLRIPGLCQRIQEEHRVMIVGPTTLAAFINSLRIGFKTLAIQKHSSEVWNLLAAVRREFGRFADILESTKKNLDAAGKHLEDAATKTRTIEKKLNNVSGLSGSAQGEALPEPREEKLD